MTSNNLVSNEKQSSQASQHIGDKDQVDLNNSEPLDAEIDPNSAEYKEIYIKLFGSLPRETDQQSDQCNNKSAYPVEEPIETLTVFDHSIIAQLSERLSIGREERRFYAGLEAKHAQKPLIQATDATLNNFKQLFVDFPNAHELLQYVYDFLCLRNISQNKAIFMPPVLVAGDPGIGKTAVIKKICSTLGVDHGFIAISSCTSNGLLAGQSSNWGGSSIGVVLKKLLYGTCANPILQLDELDKAIVNYNVNPYLALYTLLERPQMYQYVDEFAQNLPVDASNVMFFATANDLTPIPPAILSRFRVIYQSAPTNIQMRTIVANQYRQKCIEEGVEGVFPATINDDVMDYLSTKTPRETGLMLARAIAASASRFDANRNELTEITLEDLSDCQPVENQDRKMGFIW